MCAMLGIGQGSSAGDFIRERSLGVRPRIAEVVLSGHASSRHAGLKFCIQRVAFRLGVFGVEGCEHGVLRWVRRFDDV